METFEEMIKKFHGDERGVVATEYLIILILVTIGAALALLSTAVYVKSYRDFLVWWLGHPAV